MDHNLANQAFEKGSKLVILGYPTDNEFGIDLYSFRSGPNFKGIKLIPPGIHLIHYGLVGRESNSANHKTSFILNFRPYQAYVFIWNESTESLVEIDDLEQKERINQNIYEFDRYMGPYPLVEPENLYSEWLKLLYHFSNVGAEKTILENKESIRVEEINYTPFELKKSIPLDALGEERTKHALDKSYLLETIIKKCGNNGFQLFAELELAFVVFFVAQNFCALEKWKNLTALMCYSRSYMKKNGDYFNEFLNILRTQLSRFPIDFFEDLMYADNFLIETINSLIEDSEELVESKGHNQSQLSSFKTFLKEKFSYVLEERSKYEETGEYAPSIVE